MILIFEADYSMALRALRYIMPGGLLRTADDGDSGVP